jgi:hypothetical protein
MPSALRSRLTYANVVATLALVFAMSGGALAATHYLITSTKQISPKVLKKLEGREGAAGAAGKEGAAGKAGANGANGSNGSNGEGVSVSSINAGEPACSRLGGAKFAAGGKEATACNGKAGNNGLEGEKGESVTASEVKAGEAACKELGGSKFQVGSHGEETFACNGKEGSPWTDGGKLPPSATETGAWSFVENSAVAPEERHLALRVPISFPIALAEPLPRKECAEHSSECHVQAVPVLVQEGKIGAEAGELCEGKSTGTELEECEAPYKLTQQDCPSTTKEPTAMPGYLCIYIRNLYGVEGEKEDPPWGYEEPGSGGNNIGTTGLLLVVPSTGKFGTEGHGTWAVTAPVPEG